MQTSETKPQTAQLIDLGKRVPWYRRLAADILFVSKRDRKLWLLPLIALLLALAGLLTFAALAGPLAPFIYPLL